MVKQEQFGSERAGDNFLFFCRRNRGGELSAVTKTEDKRVRGDRGIGTKVEGNY